MKSRFLLALAAFCLLIPHQSPNACAMFTLVSGDVILMGTPTGSSVVRPGDVVEVEVTTPTRTSGRLRNTIGTADHPLDAAGALPRVDAATLDAAYGAGGVPESARTLLDATDGAPA